MVTWSGKYMSKAYLKTKLKQNDHLVDKGYLSASQEKLEQIRA